LLEAAMNAVVNHVHQQTRVETPVEDAFDFACQVDRQREWNPYLELFRVSGPVGAAGTHFEAILDLLGQSTPFEGSVVEAERPKVIHLYLKEAHGHADWRFRFEPAAQATLVTLEVEYEKEGALAGVVDRLVYHSALERAVRHILENFAALAPTKLPVKT
jgi:uncharacterized membrane protein